MSKREKCAAFPGKEGGSIWKWGSRSRNWEVCQERREVRSENSQVGSEGWEMRSKNREVWQARRGISKESPLLFWSRRATPEKSKLFFKNYTIIRKKNFIFALDKTQLSPFLSQNDIEIVQYPHGLSPMVRTNDLWHIAKSRYSNGEHRDIGKKRNFEI